MPSQQFNAVGDGIFTLVGGPFAPTVIYTKVTVLGPQTQVRSGTYPRRLMHAGWTAQVNGTPSANRVIVAHKYVEYEYEAWIPLSGLTDAILYNMPSGVTVQVTVYY